MSKFGKLFAVLFILSFVLVGYTCKDNTGTSLLVIGMGEGVGYSLIEHAPGAVAGCEAEFDKMMNDTIIDGKPLDPVPAEYVVRYYNTSVSIIAANIKDPDLIINRLSYLPLIFEAEYSDDGDSIISVEPVPRRLLLLFEKGYDTGKLQWQNDQAKE